eukprot:CAMPEP_0116942488 /NCGR_PEP_ID=MMETSP0467-20121206/34627_1 /TAXON_ID=283647 /ORGANISM="Mesodinium pulex, Strain SPMC105" /LENGTH=30 /DNA_ID= /DNA_START= /DNA_END= /DNA_ORIENTATION=
MHEPANAMQIPEASPGLRSKVPSRASGVSR